MRASHSFVLYAAVAFISAGCEVHDHYREPAAVGVSADVSVDEPQGEVISGPGVEEVDVEPDPAQRQYIYDEGYPPGTYLYDNYYYYGGYRYPHDLFVTHYVQENIRQRRFIDTNDNRRKGQQIEQRQKTEFAQNHGVRQHRAQQPNNPAAGHENETPRPNDQHPENRAPAVDQNRPNADHSENRAPANEQHPENRPAENRAVQPQPENRTPANENHAGAADHPEARTPAEEHKPANGATPENRAPANEPRATEEHPKNQVPADQPHNPNNDDNKHEDAK